MTPLRGMSVGYARRPEWGIRRKRRNPPHWPVCLASCPLHTAISDLGSFDRWALCRDAGKPDNRGLGECYVEQMSLVCCSCKVFMTLDKPSAVCMRRALPRSCPTGRCIPWFQYGIVLAVSSSNQSENSAQRLVCLYNVSDCIQNDQSGICLSPGTSGHGSNLVKLELCKHSATARRVEDARLL